MTGFNNISRFTGANTQQLVEYKPQSADDLSQLAGFDPHDIFLKKAQPWVKSEPLPSMRGNLYTSAEINRVSDGQVVAYLTPPEAVFKEQLTPVSYNQRLAQLTEKTANFLEKQGLHSAANELRDHLGNDLHEMDYYQHKRAELLVV